MKSVVADYKTRVFAIRIESTNGTDAVRFVDYPVDLTMGSETYQSDAGYQFTSYNATNSATPSVIDFEGILLAAGISLDSIVAGVWDNAKGYIFATSWTNPTEDEEPIGKFIVGKITIRDDRYVAELMHLIDALSQSVGRSHGPLCPWTLYDENLDGDTFANSKCGLSLADDLVTGTITDVTSNQVFVDSARTEADDFFGVGAILFTSGNNADAGVKSAEIKTYDGAASSSNGTITLFQPLPFAVQPGDAYQMIPGCRKRLEEDCRDKHDNVVNSTGSTGAGGFGGFPHMLTISQYTSIGRGS